MSKVTSFSIEDILTRRRLEEMKENDMMRKSPCADTSRSSSPVEEAASSGGRGSSTASSPAPTSPVSEGRLSPKIVPKEEPVGLRDVGGFDPKHHSMFQHHHSHHTNLTTPPYFPYYPANAMIQGPPGEPPLFVQTSFGMVPASHHHSRPVSLQRQHPSATAGVIGGTSPHSHIPGHDASRLQGQQSPTSQHSAGVSSPRSSASDGPTIQSLKSRDSNPSHYVNHREYRHNPHQANPVHPLRDVKRESAFASTHQSDKAIQSREENDAHSNGQNFIQRTNSADIENTENNRKDTDTNNYDDDDILVDVENVNSPLGSMVESDEEGEEEEGCPSESGDARSTCSSSRDLHGGSEPNEKKGT